MPQLLMPVVPSAPDIAVPAAAPVPAGIGAFEAQLAALLPAATGSGQMPAAPPVEAQGLAGIAPALPGAAPAALSNEVATPQRPAGAMQPRGSAAAAARRVIQTLPDGPAAPGPAQPAWPPPILPPMAVAAPCGSEPVPVPITHAAAELPAPAGLAAVPALSAEVPSLPPAMNAEAAPQVAAAAEPVAAPAEAAAEPSDPRPDALPVLSDRAVPPRQAATPVAPLFAPAQEAASPSAVPAPLGVVQPPPDDVPRSEPARAGPRDAIAPAGKPAAAVAGDRRSAAPPQFTGQLVVADPDPRVSDAPATQPDATPPPRPDANPAPVVPPPPLSGGTEPPPATPHAAMAADPRPDASDRAPPPAEQLASAVVSFAQARGAPARLTLQLQPRELGHVQIRIDQLDNGSAHIAIAVQRQETMTMLLRDQSQLHRALDQAGVAPQGRTVTIDVVQPASGGSSGDPHMGGMAGDRSPNGGRNFAEFQRNQDGAATAADEPSGLLESGPWRPRLLRAGLDITA